MNKVLLVEDNHLNLKLFYDLLESQNCEILTSQDGLDVFNTVIKEQPNLVLMDIQLNGISGLDLIIELKNDIKTRHIPVIAITAFTMENDKIKIKESGCDLYLSKPVSIDNFISAVNKFLNPI